MLLSSEFWTWSCRICGIICVAWALWRGGRVERVAAAAITLGWIATIIVSDKSHPDGTAYAIVDIVAFCVFAAIAIWSRKIWTLFLAACQLVAVASHFSAALSNFGADDIGWWAYSAIINFWSGWGLLASLAVGVWQHRHHKKKALREQASVI